MQKPKGILSLPNERIWAAYHSFKQGKPSGFNQKGFGWALSAKWTSVESFQNRGDLAALPSKEEEAPNPYLSRDETLSIRVAERQICQNSLSSTSWVKFFTFSAMLEDWERLLSFKCLKTTERWLWENFQPEPVSRELDPLLARHTTMP